MPAAAASNERSLYLYYTHTGETARIVFKRNGKYVKEGLDQLNYFLRDWRRNEPAKMDPALFDLVWSVYQEVGATQPINVVSAYRSPATNEMLRSVPGSGVAENSQHTKGHAMDFFIPGVELTTLRAVAMRHQVGGVGYYPTSGSPFVHLDTGSVRAWPRMTKAQLKKIFPDGRTLHLPAEGPPLSEEGRAYAQLQWNQCHMVPCSGAANTLLASKDGDQTGGSNGKTTLMDMIFGNGNNKSQADQVAVASADPTQRVVQTIEIAPVPAVRPAGLGTPATLTASIDPVVQPASLPFSTQGSAPLTETEMAGSLDPEAPIPATRPTGPQDAVTAIASIDADAPIPAARILMTNPPDMMSAYAPQIDPDPETRPVALLQQAALPPVPTAKAPQPVAQANTGNAGLGTLSGLVDMTWNAVSKTQADQPMIEALQQVAATQPLHSVPVRPSALIAPDLDHVAEVFAQPVSLLDAQFAVMYEPEGYFDKSAELGPLIARMGFMTGPDQLAPDQFRHVKPQLVAAR